MSAIAIRPEAIGDEKAIRMLTEAAFRDMAYSDGSEHVLVDRLRSANELTLSLVATDRERIVGHIAFSPVTISDGTGDWYGLGPVSVWPELHGKGIGSQLVTQGVATMRQRGAAGIVLLGAPAYYSRFGFEHDPLLTYPGPPAEYFQRLVLSGEAPSGTVCYNEAFG